jgi:hypothetical protein
MHDLEAILKQIDEIQAQLEAVNEILKGNEPSA